jgi:hypothetical protein
MPKGKSYTVVHRIEVLIIESESMPVFNYSHIIRAFEYNNPSH